MTKDEILATLRSAEPQLQLRELHIQLNLPEVKKAAVTEAAAVEVKDQS